MLWDIADGLEQIGSFGDECRDKPAEIVLRRLTLEANAGVAMVRRLRISTLLSLVTPFLQTHLSELRFEKEQVAPL